MPAIMAEKPPRSAILASYIKDFSLYFLLESVVNLDVVGVSFYAIRISGF